LNRQNSMRKALCCDVPSRTLNKCGCEKTDNGCQKNETWNRFGRAEQYEASCACGCANTSRDGTFDKEFALGIAYVPVQCWKGITCNETSLKNGTVFEELTKPFTGCERRRMHG